MRTLQTHGLSLDLVRLTHAILTTGPMILLNSHLCNDVSMDVGHKLAESSLLGLLCKLFSKNETHQTLTTPPVYTYWCT